jgi:hypothetical protein
VTISLRAEAPPLLFDPFANVTHGFGKSGPAEKPSKEARDASRAKNRQLIQDALKAWKNVAFLEYGDPTIYSPWRGWLDGNLNERVEFSMHRSISLDQRRQRSQGSAWVRRPPP